MRNAKEGVLETERSSLINRTRSQDFRTVFARGIRRLSIFHATAYILPKLMTECYSFKNFLWLRPKGRLHNCAFSAHCSKDLCYAVSAAMLYSVTGRRHSFSWTDFYSPPRLFVSALEIFNFKVSFVSQFPKETLENRETPSNIELCTESIGAMLEYWYIERGVFLYGYLATEGLGSTANLIGWSRYWQRSRFSRPASRTITFCGEKLQTKIQFKKGWIFLLEVLKSMTRKRSNKNEETLTGSSSAHRC